MLDFTGSYVAFIFSYFIPGFVVLSAAGTSYTLGLLLAIPVGIALWGWQGWIFGFLQIRWMSYLYLVAAVISFIWLLVRKRQTVFPEMNFRKLHADYVSISIIILGVLIQSIMVWNVFVPFHGSVAECCINEVDAVWYASITKSLLRSFPPDYPGLAGQTLHNYHYWSNLVAADIIRVLHTDQFLMQFRYSGILLSLLLGLTAVGLVTALKSTASVRRWLLFFLYFGGDALYVMPLITQRVFGFPGSSLEDGVRFLGNPPRSYAVVLAFAWLTLWITWHKKLSWRRTVVLALLLASTIGFKIYIAVFLYVGLAAVVLWDLIHKRFTYLPLAMLGGILAAAVYLPVNAAAGGFIYTGFWRFDDFIVQPGLGLIRIELARKIFEHDHKVAKVLVFEWFYVAVYVITIFGSKLIAFIQSKKSLASIPIVVHVFLITSIIFNFILGSFFIQTTGGSNTFNFHVNVYIFLSIYTALGASTLTELFQKNRILKAIVILFIVLITIPRAIDVSKILIRSTTNLKPFIDPPTQTIIQRLSRTPKDSIIAVKTRYLPMDMKTSYLYLFSDRLQYLSAVSLLEYTFGADVADRIHTIDVLTKVGTPSAQRRIIQNEKINYILLDNDVGVYIATASAYGITPVEVTGWFTLYKVGTAVIR